VHKDQRIYSLKVKQKFTVGFKTRLEDTYRHITQYVRHSRLKCFVIYIVDKIKEITKILITC